MLVDVLLLLNISLVDCPKHVKLFFFFFFWLNSVDDVQPTGMRVRPERGH